MSLLRQIFGPSQVEIWQKLSDETGAELVKGGFWRGDKVVIRVKEWTITLDTYTQSTGKTHVTYTRLRAPYVNQDEFRFRICRKHVFSGLARVLGFQDVETGHPEFDAEFVIKSNKPPKVRELFANAALRELLRAQPRVLLEVKDDEGWFGADFPDGVDELSFHVPHRIKDVGRLKELYKIFALTLNQLCLIGAAYDRDPGVKL
jgi:hypothetical protein